VSPGCARASGGFGIWIFARSLDFGFFVSTVFLLLAAPLMPPYFEGRPFYCTRHTVLWLLLDAGRTLVSEEKELLWRR